jgi:DNA ligase (NAD+)
LLLEPTLLSGALISRVTAHHAGNVMRLGLGAGAIIELVRSGEVIPFAKQTLTAVLGEVVSHCPCCNNPVSWEGDFIVCNNSNCSARLASSLEYHFKLLGADLFGGKTTEKLVEAGLTTIQSIYSVTHSALTQAGFGDKQAENLINEIIRIKATPVKDNLVLASLGIHACGRGTSKSILKTLTLNEAGKITYSHLMSLKGFAEITSTSISRGVADSIDDINFLISTLKIEQTKKAASSLASASLAGLSFVFTGSMPLSREEMKEHAESRSGTVQSSVSGKTSFLVIGDKVGAKKISDAQSKNVQVITVDEYFAKAG